MDMLISVLSSIFWGLVVLSVLVGIHEGGHFLASRACGVRVTEFFLGLPCRFNLHHVSRRIGTKFGVTPILLGGYAMVCGMDPEDNTHAASVLGSFMPRVCSPLKILRRSSTSLKTMPWSHAFS